MVKAVRARSPSPHRPRGDRGVGRGQQAARLGQGHDRAQGVSQVVIGEMLLFLPRPAPAGLRSQHVQIALLGGDRLLKFGVLLFKETDLLFEDSLKPPRQAMRYQLGPIEPQQCDVKGACWC